MTITVEELYKATEKDVGKLCYFWDTGYESIPHLDILESYSANSDYPYEALNKGVEYQHARQLTPKEVEELTGYEVKLQPIKDESEVIKTNETIRCF